MIPDKIFLVRHGELEGNVNWDLYKTVPDYKMNLTERGRQQAKEAGEKIGKNLVLNLGAVSKICRIYSSPWYRARQTSEEIIKVLGNDDLIDYREDPRICEQQWGNYQSDHVMERIDRERDEFGTFFYRMPDGGESGLDVYTRVSFFLESLWRDFKSERCPSNIIIVSHGLTLRLFLMRWFHWTVEEYESYANPPNGAVIEMGNISDKFHITSNLRKKSGNKRKNRKVVK